MKLIPWSPPRIPVEVGAVLVPQQKAGAVTWDLYLSLLEAQVRRMIRRESDLPGLLSLYRMGPLAEEPLESLPELLIREDLVWIPVSRALSRDWPLAAMSNRMAEKVLSSNRGLRNWLARCEQMAEQKA